MTTRGEAYVLATLIYGDKEAPVEDLAEQLAVAMACMYMMTDDCKADLYALLAEGLTEDTRFAQAVVFVEDCLIKNKRRFPHG